MPRKRPIAVSGAACRVGPITEVRPGTDARSLTLSRFVELDQAHHVGAFNSSQWTVAVAGDDNFVVRPNYKFCGLNEITPIFPPSPHRAGNIAGDRCVAPLHFCSGSIATKPSSPRCLHVAFPLTLVSISGTQPTNLAHEGRLREGTPGSGASAVPARGFAIRSRATRTPPGRHKDRPARSSLDWRMGNAGCSASGRCPRKRGPELKPVGGNPANGKAAAKRRKAGASRTDAPPRSKRGRWLACAFRRFASLSFFGRPLA